MNNGNGCSKMEEYRKEPKYLLVGLVTDGRKTKPGNYEVVSKALYEKSNVDRELGVVNYRAAKIYTIGSDIRVEYGYEELEEIRREYKKQIELAEYERLKKKYE